MKKFLFALILVFVFAFPTVSRAQDFGAQSFGVRHAISGAAIAQPQPEVVDGYLQHFGIGFGLHTGLPDFLGFSAMLNLNESFALVGTYGYLPSLVLEYRFPISDRTVLGVIGGIASMSTYNQNSGVNSNLGFELGVVIYSWGPGGKDRIPIVVAGGTRVSIALAANSEQVVLHLIFGFMMGVFFEQAFSV
jgi:hypothetical protein